MKAPRTLAPLLVALIAAGCSERGITDARVPAAPEPEPGYAIAEIACSASVQTGVIRCGDQLGTDVTRDWIIGGQNVNVRLASTNVSYDSTTQIFSADVTVQNLRLEKFGTDGPDTTGIYVFFHQPPATVSGTGAATVRNADGEGTFTSPGQAYFHYPEVLAYQELSTVKRWEWDVPRSVDQFQFRVFLATRVLPVLVFDLSVGGNTDIYRMALDGTDLVRLTTHSATDANPAAGPGIVVFTSTRDGSQELFKLSPFGGVETQLTFTTGETMDAPAVSSDGTRIAFARAIGQDFYRLRVMNVNGGDTAAIAGADGTVDTNPSWKPHSDSLVFVSASGFADGDAGIYRTRTGAAVATGLVTRVGADIDPAWSPDGRYIAFSSPRGGSNDNLYLLDLVTMVTTQLTSAPTNEYSPAWTSDGRIVFVLSNGTTKELRWLDPANPTVIHTVPGVAVTGQQRLNHAVFPF